MLPIKCIQEKVHTEAKIVQNLSDFLDKVLCHINVVGGSRNEARKFKHMAWQIENQECCGDKQKCSGYTHLLLGSEGSELGAFGISHRKTFLTFFLETGCGKGNSDVHVTNKHKRDQHCEHSIQPSHYI